MFLHVYKTIYWLKSTHQGLAKKEYIIHFRLREKLSGRKIIGGKISSVTSWREKNYGEGKTFLAWYEIWQGITASLYLVKLI